MFKQKSRFLRVAALGVVMGCLGGAQSTPAQAQNEGAIKSQLRSMRVRNVRPSIMAWWLDPKNNPEPSEIRAARMNVDDIAERPNILGSAANEATSPTHLTGVQRVTGVDAQNVILAVANDADWANFQKIVEALDKPIPQIEISMTQVEIPKDDAVQAGWWKQNEKPSEVLKTPTSKFDETLLTMQKTGRLKIINSPRVTAMNNLPASLGTVGMQPVKLTLDTGVAPGAGQDFATVTYPNTQFMMKRERKVTAIPTANNDGTVTLLLTLAEPLYLVRGSLNDPDRVPRNLQEIYGGKSQPELLLDKGEKLTSILNLKSDETVFMSAWNGSTPATANGIAPDKNQTIRLTFVSARRID